jgi:hypothetical protein
MSGRSKWAIVAIVGVIVGVAGGFLVIGPRQGVCRPPLLEVMRDDPTKSAVRLDLVDDLAQRDRQALRRKVGQVEGVRAVRTPNARTFVVTGTEADTADKVAAAVEGDPAVTTVTPLGAEDPRIQRCKDDATPQLAIGAPLLVIGLATMVFGIVRYHRAGLAVATEEHPPPET